VRTKEEEKSFLMLLPLPLDAAGFDTRIFVLRQSLAIVGCRSDLLVRSCMRIDPSKSSMLLALLSITAIPASCLSHWPVNAHFSTYHCVDHLKIQRIWSGGESITSVT